VLNVVRGIVPFAPEITGAIEAPFTAAPFSEDIARKRREFAEAKQERFAGEFATAGGVVSPLGRTVGKAQTALSAAARAVPVAAAFGASEAGPGSRLAGGVIGGLAGATFAGATKFGARAVARAPERAEEFSLSGLKQGVQKSTKERVFRDRAAESRVRTALKENPDIASLARNEPEQALQLIEQTKLAPLQARQNKIVEMAHRVTKGVPIKKVDAALAKVEKSFRTAKEKPLRNAVQDFRQDFIETRIPPGKLKGKPEIPLNELNDEIAAVQKVGFGGRADLPPGSVKEVDRRVGFAMRDALIDEVERVSKAKPFLGISGAELDATKKNMSVWLGISDLLEEKTKRIIQQAPTLTTTLGKLPLLSAAKRLGQEVAGATDVRVLGPLVGAGRRVPGIARTAVEIERAATGLGATRGPVLPGAAAGAIFPQRDDDAKLLEDIID